MSGGEASREDPLADAFEAVFGYRPGPAAVDADPDDDVDPFDADDVDPFDADEAANRYFNRS